MKLATIFLICFAIQFAIIINSQGTSTESTPLLESALNPTDFSNLLSFTVFMSVAAALTLGGAFVGSLVLNRPDLVIFGGMVSVFITWAMPIVSLYRMVITSNVFGNEVVSTIAGLGAVTATQLFAALLVGPLIILALFSIITWWRTTFEG